ncbi:hypothetical protein ACVGW6_04205, partial [Enterobacter intestinihominis]
FILYWVFLAHGLFFYFFVVVFFFFFLRLRWFLWWGLKNKNLFIIFWALLKFFMGGGGVGLQGRALVCFGGLPAAPPGKNVKSPRRLLRRYGYGSRAPRQR